VFEGCHKECGQESSLRIEVEDSPEGSEIFKRSLEAGKRPSTLNLVRGVVSFHAGEQVSTEECLVHFIEIFRKDGRSKFSEGNLRIFVSC
jgi:hypothetical protein